MSKARTHTSIRFLPEILDEVDRLAELSRRSRNQVLEMLVLEALKNDPESILGAKGEAE